MSLSILRVSKPALIILTTAFFHVSAAANPPLITLNGKNVSLSKAFASIEKQTGYHFLYDKSQWIKDLPVTIELQNATIAMALSECIKNTPLGYVIDGNTIIISVKTSSTDQQPRSVNSPPATIEVKGIVLSARRELMSGVTISVKGSGSATTSNRSGNYSISVPDNDTLVYSFVGYTTQEIPVAGRTNIDVTL